MTKQKFDNEKNYHATMMFARKLLEQGIINDEEYREIDTKFKEKYHVSLSNIFTDIDLINSGNRANM